MQGLFFKIFVIRIAFAAIEPSENYSHHVTLKANGEYELYWKVSGFNGNDVITFEIIANTSGWVGLGLSPNGAMTNADIFLGGVNDTTNAGYLYVSAVVQHQMRNLTGLDHHVVITLQRRVSLSQNCKK